MDQSKNFVELLIKIIDSKSDIAINYNNANDFFIKKFHSLLDKAIFESYSQLGSLVNSSSVKSIKNESVYKDHFPLIKNIPETNPNLFIIDGMIYKSNYASAEIIIAGANPILSQYLDSQISRLIVERVHSRDIPYYFIRLDHDQLSDTISIGDSSKHRNGGPSPEMFKFKKESGVDSSFLKEMKDLHNNKNLSSSDDK